MDKIVGADGERATKVMTIPPIRLSFADQARFAAETIRRLDANGRFGTIVY